MESAPPAGPTGPWIIEADIRNFEREVIQRSRSVPVVLDFWAAWCGPCKTLGPLLERRAREGNGRFVLAKVDVDRSPDLAQAFRIQGIPAVMAVVDGRLADGFQGALPEAELDRFLDRIAPGPELTPLDEARALAESGALDEAISCLREFVEDQPDHAEARITLGGLLVDAGRPAEAEEALQALAPAARETPAAKAVLARVGFAAAAGDLAELERAARERPGDAAAQLALGRAAVAAGRHAQGLEALLGALRLDPEGVGPQAKQAMREAFDLLGLENPLANEYRFKLSMELFN